MATIITAIERQKKRRGRVEVWVDGELRFDVSSALARSRGLRVGSTIDPSDIEEIVALDARQAAMHIAMSMLARRPHSQREVRRRLAMRRVDAPLIEETITKLISARLIDDGEFARAWVDARDRCSPRGQRLIASELRARGVEVDIASSAVAEVCEEDGAYRLASKRVRGLAQADYRTFREKLGGHLQRKGFGWDVSRATVARCWSELGRHTDGDAAFDDLADPIE
jgi:regulatory protein